MSEFERDVCALMGSAIVRQMFRVSPADATEEWRRYHAQLVFDLYEADVGRYAMNCEELKRWMFSEDGRDVMLQHVLLERWADWAD